MVILALNASNDREEDYQIVSARGILPSNVHIASSSPPRSVSSQGLKMSMLNENEPNVTYLRR